MFARNHWSTGFGTRVAFADLGGRQLSWTGDRKEFLGRNGTLDRPAALAASAPPNESGGWRARSRAAPCKPGSIWNPAGTEEIVLFLGQTATKAEALSLITRYRAADLDAVFNAT